MPNWKKVVVSGSNAELNAVTVSSVTSTGGVSGTVITAISALIGDNTIWTPSLTRISGSFSGSFQGDGSRITNVSASSAISSSFATTSSFSTSSSFATTASFAVSSSRSVTSSFASTASFVNQLNQNVVITGSLTVSGSADYSITARAITLNANGAPYIKGGDDAEIWDINVANTVGIYGTSDQGIGSLKLGSGGGILSGRSGSLGVNIVLPYTGAYSGSLHVNGNVFATSFTGSLLGTSSWASNAVNANTASYVLNAISSSYSTFANASQFSYGVRTIVSGVGATWYIPYVFYSTTSSSNDTDFQNLVTTSSLTYNPVTQLLTATASRAVSSSIATTASYVLNAVSSSFAGVASSSIITGTNEAVNHFLIFTKNTGSVSLLTDTASNGIRYNPNTNELGTVTTNGTHLGDIQVTQQSNDRNYYVLFATGGAGVYTSQLLYDTPYRYDTQTKTLAVTNFSGSKVTATTVSASVVTSSVQIIGDAPMLMTSARVTQAFPGQFTVYSLPTASYNMAVFEWTATSGSTIKSATYQAHRVGTTLQYGQYGPVTIGAGSTDISLIVAVTGSNFALTGSCISSGWSIKAIIRGL